MNTKILTIFLAIMLLPLAIAASNGSMSVLLDWQSADTNSLMVEPGVPAVFAYAADDLNFSGNTNYEITLTDSNGNLVDSPIAISYEESKFVDGKFQVTGNASIDTTALSGNYLINFIFTNYNSHAQVTGNLSLQVLSNAPVINNVPILYPIPDQYAYVNDKVEFTLHALDAENNQLWYNAESFAPGMTLNTQSGNFFWTPQYAGNYLMTFSVTDGNSFDYKSMNIIVSHAPSISQPTVGNLTITPIDDKVINEGTTLSFAVSNEEGVAATYSAQVCSPSLLNLNCSRRNAWTTVSNSIMGQNGNFKLSTTFATLEHPAIQKILNYRVKAVAADGTSSNLENFSVTINDVNRDPVLSVSPETNHAVYEFQVGEEIGLILTVLDRDNDKVSVSLSTMQDYTLPSSLELVELGHNQFSLQGKIMDEGTFGLFAAATDNYGGEDKLPLVFSVTKDTTVPPADNHRPSLRLLRNQVVLEGETLNLQLHGYDLDSEELTYLLDGLNQCSSLDIFCKIKNYFGSKLPAVEKYTFNAQTGLFTFSPDYEFVQHPDDKNSFTVKFAVKDAQETSAWQSVTITVKDVNRLPEIAVSNDTTGTVGEEFHLQFNAADADNDNLTLTLEGAVPGLTFTANGNQAELAGVATQEGEFTIVIKVTDGTDTVELPVIITINNHQEPGSGSEGKPDTDGDGLNDDEDNCPYTYNPNQEDADHDGIGDNCDDSPVGRSNLEIVSARISPEVASAGEPVYISVNAGNNGKADLLALRTSATIYDLGLKNSGSQFKLKAGKEQTTVLSLQLPYDALPGDYIIKLTVGNDEIHESTYRMITIR